MKTYEKYKPSGIEFLGDIPSHWEVKRLAALGRFSKGGNISRSDLLFSDDAVPAILYGDLYTKYDVIVERPVNRISLETAERAARLSKGDLLFAGSGETKEDIGKCVLFHGAEPAYAGGDIIIFRQVDADSHFISYSQNSWAAHFQKTASSKGEIVVHTYGSALKNVVMPYPPIQEQTAIADYLDKETARIDEVVGKKKRLIELLKEERLAIINQAVTRGLDAATKLKPSNIEWLGDIPEHWEVKKLKHIAELKSGDGITSESIQEDGNYPVFGGNGFRGYFSSFTHEGDFVLIGRQGALCGNINYASGKFWASDHAVVVTLLENDEMVWLGELLTVMNLNQYSQSAAQPGLSVEMIKNLAIPVPPITEQIKLVEFIRSGAHKIDATISKIKEEIRLLNEYRTALISEVVTGKIDVRN